jgi:hypothetical protein
MWKTFGDLSSSIHRVPLLKEGLRISGNLEQLYQPTTSFLDSSEQDRGMASRNDRKRHKSSTLTNNSKFVADLKAEKRSSFQR